MSRVVFRRRKAPPAHSTNCFLQTAALPGCPRPSAHARPFRQVPPYLDIASLPSRPSSRTAPSPPPHRTRPPAAPRAHFRPRHVPFPRHFTVSLPQCEMPQAVFPSCGSPPQSVFLDVHMEAVQHYLCILFPDLFLRTPPPLPRC